MRTRKGKMMIRGKKSATRKPRANGKRKNRRSGTPTLAVGHVQMEGGRVVVLGSTFGPYPPSLWFWNDPPTPDPRFAPFYARAAAGDTHALLDYYRLHWSDPGAAFYQSIGYLAARGNVQEVKVIREIMRINQRGGPQTFSDARRESARNLAKRLLPIAQTASSWISQQRKADQRHGHSFSSREVLWQKYVDENAGGETPATLRKQLLNEFGPQKETPPDQARAVRLTNKELRAQQLSNLRFIASMYFSRGLVPKSYPCSIHARKDFSLNRCSPAGRENCYLTA
jgi:hypothetical protein